MGRSMGQWGGNFSGMGRRVGEEAIHFLHINHPLTPPHRLLIDSSSTLLTDIYRY